MGMEQAMSNRSLFEFNHDFAERIERDPNGFTLAISEYLRSGSPAAAEFLKRHFGLTWYGMRHHSDDWEAHIDTEGAK
jgi:hypothetical protein